MPSLEETILSVLYCIKKQLHCVRECTVLSLDVTYTTYIIILDILKCLPLSFRNREAAADPQTSAAAPAMVCSEAPVASCSHSVDTSKGLEIELVELERDKDAEIAAVMQRYYQKKIEILKKYKH